MLEIGLTDHVEGPRGAGSAEIYEQVADLVRLADGLGVRYAWFAEHHAHAHEGHLPTPLLLALHLAGETRRIHLGSAVVCLNLHHPLDVAEQVAVADTLMAGRLAPGFGSGSTDDESRLFGVAPSGETERHIQFERGLTTILHAWQSDTVNTQSALPTPRQDLAARCWLAVNSLGAAKIAGRLGFNVLFSHLRTVGQYQEYFAAYRAAGGTGRVPANRPIFVGPDDKTALAQAEPALRILWQRFSQEGKIGPDISEPSNVMELCAHPINFIVGGPETVAAQLRNLRQQFAFDVLNVEIRWAGLNHDLVRGSLQRLMQNVVPQL